MRDCCLGSALLCGALLPSLKDEMHVGVRHSRRQRYTGPAGWVMRHAVGFVMGRGRGLCGDMNRYLDVKGIVVVVHGRQEVHVLP